MLLSRHYSYVNAKETPYFSDRLGEDCHIKKFPQYTRKPLRTEHEDLLPQKSHCADSAFHLQRNPAELQTCSSTNVCLTCLSSPE